ncbi:hypothetical protein [Gordonia zhenghanii]|uniref:hypothetical protein n=1 Tax=Gordonia zhenghanii TaxID=2911516 RepID=UPI001F3A5645|nr:hypothetical protein [Gordonia zhenghanii]
MPAPEADDSESGAEPAGDDSAPVESTEPPVDDGGDTDLPDLGEDPETASP